MTHSLLILLNVHGDREQTEHNQINLALGGDVDHGAGAVELGADEPGGVAAHGEAARHPAARVNRVRRHSWRSSLAATGAKGQQRLRRREESERGSGETRGKVKGKTVSSHAL
ncbi:hypothetical protein GQ55_2G424400 [Panicum hallii var. hallii]|uniref:Uncharacterized protein n=1 Tax=Panicum hallii var. hallii TaxID=1504633 RepID=A0A2T7EY88_9POAL|nr:hypothetical protein GQ55_2G424400 [Panicum hallii var. hallii]